MGYRREPFEVGEWYHCYNRGIDKRSVFGSEFDSDRFLQSLYLCNNADAVGRSDFDHYKHARIFQIERLEPLVAIGAYSLMPNHFHLLLQEITDSGISRFMHKLGTSYTMYFNEKNTRVGNLFYKPFRSRRVSRELHFRHLPHYIHLNPIELFEPGWKKGVTKKQLRDIERELSEYRFSSYMDYRGGKRPEGAILAPAVRELFMEELADTMSVLSDAKGYYAALELS